MRNQNFISEIIDYSDNRTKELEYELKDLEEQSKSKHVIENIETLAYIKKQYEQYSTELKLLTDLQKFYSGVI